MTWEVYMSCYFVAQIKIEDEAEYQKYIKGAGDIFKKYNGVYLAVDNNPMVLEGEWGYSRIVIIRFPDEEDLKQWYNSSEYQEILKYRLKAAKCDTLVVNGLE
jgi:uncharacterized protein (DUF1330 family)